MTILPYKKGLLIQIGANTASRNSQPLLNHQSSQIRKGRQLCREILGPDAVFIVMNLTKSCQKKRIEARHGSDSGIHQMLTRVFDIYEPAGEDEDGAYNVTITEDMTRQDVLKEVLGVIAKI